MSPVARSRGHAGKALVVAAIGVIVALGIALGVSVLAGRGDVEVRLGDDTFDAGDAESVAAEIAEHGPVIYSDVAGGTRDIILQHQGDGPKIGWSAFDARPLDAPRDCIVKWKAEEEVFKSQCSDEEFPADGSGLPTYPVTVRDGKVDIDLRG